jgi:hypothetical protein
MSLTLNGLAPVATERRYGSPTPGSRYRLNGLIEIGRPEHEALEVAKQALRSLKAQQVDAMVGETLGP